MKHNILFCVFLLIIFAFLNGCRTASKAIKPESNLLPPASSTSQKPTDDNLSYIIGPGDVLKISVWLHPDLKDEVVVKPDGKFSFPIVHDVKAEGLKPTELENVLASGLGKIIKNPDVTVNVTYFTSQKIFVLGEVEKPGVYPFPGNVTVLDAILYAGGYLDTAAINSILLIREGIAKRINMTDIIRKGDLSRNFSLQSKDIIFVPKSFIAEIDKFVDLFFTKTDPILKYYLDFMDIKHYHSTSRVRT